ncbi:MAG: hypothetical protein FWG57_02200 [Endomicrobia bacterium]|nr:hypothetical protein [Endomicrobiia bacterium]
MIKLSKNSKVFVPCPAGVVTGGVELLHQLVDFLRRNNVDAYIFYFGEKPHGIPAAYEKYNILISENIYDSDENVVVLPEIIFNWVYKFKKVQFILWWLSVDNFFYAGASISDIFKFNMKLGLKTARRRLKKLLLIKQNEFKDSISVAYLKKLDVINAYQSAYAQHFLYNSNMNCVLPLTDYINSEYYSDNIDFNVKEDIVAYNPAKGLKFTNRLISKMRNIKFIPIQNMNRKQVCDLLKKAKVYIDFGNHPGKDRLPREAALAGCIIITGKNGAARFFEDIPINSYYKMDRNIRNIDMICGRIIDSIQNYSVRIGDMDYYRDLILHEKQKFECEIRKIFDIRIK